MVALVFIFGRVKMTEVVPEVQRNHPSRAMADRLFLGQFVMLLISLILKLAAAFIILFYVLDYIQEESETAFRIGKTCYNMSWTYMYLAYNAILYQWVFSVHRVNLYGGIIDVQSFRYRKDMNWLLYTSIVGIIFFINTVVILVEAVFPLETRSIIVESFILIDFCTLFIVFVIVGSVLIIKLEAYFGKNYLM